MSDTEQIILRTYTIYLKKLEIWGRGYIYIYIYIYIYNIHMTILFRLVPCFVFSVCRENSRRFFGTLSPYSLCVKLSKALSTVRWRPLFDLFWEQGYHLV